MAIIHNHDKRLGITYVYNSTAYWDKEKKQSRAKRTLIGKLDPVTNEVVPTDGRGRSKTKNVSRTDPNKTESTEQPIPLPVTKRSFFGATHLLDVIGEKIGIKEDLQNCFPKTWQQILSIVYYSILEDKSPLYRFEKWHHLHQHPYGQNITSQRSSELFSSITENQKQMFFKRQGERRLEKEYWAYDITTISSYSQTLSQVQYGHNKEEDTLPQLNLALVFGETSKLPFYYRKLAGNTPDVKTVQHLLTSLDDLGFSKTKMVMDRGFNSDKNIADLYKKGVKFLIGGKMSRSFMKDNLDTIYDNFKRFDSFNEDFALYHQTVRTTFAQSKAPTQKKHKIYIHYYFNIDQAAEDEKALDLKIARLRNDLLNNTRNDADLKLYDKYFTVKKTPKRGICVTVNNEAVQNAKRYNGFFALLTNEKMDAIQALRIYRQKDVVEKAFGNLKERLNMRRMLVSSEQSLDGKLFVQFVALIYLSYLQKEMQKTELFKKYTMQEMLDKLDLIECFQLNGQKPFIGEIMEKQKEILKILDCPLPTSLCVPGI
jgi:transposase